VPQRQAPVGGFARLLRWLGFGRGPNYGLLNEPHDHLLNETHIRPAPVHEKTRSETAPQNRYPKELAQSLDSQTQTSSVDLQTLDRAVSRLLEKEPGSWEIERFLESLQHTLGGNDSVEIQHLVSPSDGKGRLIALWPQGSQVGLALVTAGELADDEIVRYFEVAFGRRIIACRQPARVSRSGDEVTVLQKGKVESS
jgi:hypothetical protein